MSAPNPVGILRSKSATLSRTKLSVVHIEDDPLWARETAACLRRWPEVRYLGTARNAKEGIKLCRATKPAVAILDLILPDMCGLELWDHLREKQPRLKILPLTCRSDEVVLHRLVSGKSPGLIWKRNDFAKHLRPALTTLTKGGNYFPPNVAESLRKFRSSPNAFYKILSSWEIFLVSLFSHGLRDEEIARRIGLKKETIRNHRLNITKKAGLEKRHNLMDWAKERGFGRALDRSFSSAS
jgi:DNA-binding NarL/FixJ family response regulator